MLLLGAADGAMWGSAAAHAASRTPTTTRATRATMAPDMPICSALPRRAQPSRGSRHWSFCYSLMHLHGTGLPVDRCARCPHLSRRCSSHSGTGRCGPDAQERIRQRCARDDSPEAASDGRRL